MKENIIYGLHPVLEAIESDTEITKIFISTTADFSRMQPILRLAEQNNISVTRVPVVRLEKFVGENNHQGVVAQTSPAKYWDLEVLIAKTLMTEKNPIFLFLDGVTDTRNLGGIARSAACLGIKGIILPSQGSANITDDTVKTSAGAILKIPVARIGNVKLAIHTLLAEGFNIVGITEKTDTKISEIDYDQPTVLVFGGEQRGISTPIIKLASDLAKIPMVDEGVSSLNVSVAVGIAAYEIARQKEK